MHFGKASVNPESRLEGPRTGKQNIHPGDTVAVCDMARNHTWLTGACFTRHKGGGETKVAQERRTPALSSKANLKDLMQIDVKQKRLLWMKMSWSNRWGRTMPVGKKKQKKLKKKGQDGFDTHRWVQTLHQPVRSICGRQRALTQPADMISVTESLSDASGEE